LKQNNLKFLIRTAGGKARKKELGFGHIYRCINLASNLQVDEIYFEIEDYGGVEEILRKNGFSNIVRLKTDIDTSSDIKKTLQLVKKKKIDVLIIDKYKITSRYISEVRKSVKTVLISDLRNIDYPADLVVNGFIGFKSDIIRNRYGIKCLVGPSYQILNKKFARKSQQKKKYSLLATFGGFDENNIVTTLLRMLEKYLPKMKTKIILGPSTPKSKWIQLLEKKYTRYLKVVNETNDMHKEIAQARFGLCSGGITTYEFAAMNVPFAIICQVKHQLITAQEWQKKGIALNLGLVSNRTSMRTDRLLHGLLTTRIHKKIINKNVVDGFGTQRVVNQILRMVQSTSPKI